MALVILLEQGGWSRLSPEVPCNISHSVILWFCEVEKLRM